MRALFTFQKQQNLSLVKVCDEGRLNIGQQVNTEPSHQSENIFYKFQIKRNIYCI